MSSATSSTKKMIAFALLFIILTVVSGNCPAKCHCSRFKTFCSLARLNKLPTELLNTTQLLRIELDNITRINTTKCLQNISHLQLVHVNLQEIQPGAFQEMSRLEYLEINFNEINRLKRNSFTDLENLYFLNLSGNNIKYLEAGALSGIQNLRILDLSGNYITQLNENVFEGWGYNDTNIAEYENLFNNSRIEPKAFKYLTKLRYFKLTRNLEYLIPPDISFGLRISLHFYGTDITYVNKKRNHIISELSYLYLSNVELEHLSSKGFQNFTKLAYLRLQGHFIQQTIQRNKLYLEGFITLKTLDIQGNYIAFLNNGTFHGLESLEKLDISYSQVSNIETNAFEGLSKLRILDLSWNKLQRLKKYIFSQLRMLKELNLEGNKIRQIHHKAFSPLSYLKSISVYTPYGIHLTLLGKYDDQHLKRIKPINQATFLDLERLDNLHIQGDIALPQDIQVLKYLHLHIDTETVNPELKLRDLLKGVRYSKNLHVTLYNVNSTQILTTLSEFNICQLHIFFTDFKCLNSDSLNDFSVTRLDASFSTLNTLRGAVFHKMTELKLFYSSFDTNNTFIKGFTSGFRNVLVQYIENPYTKRDVSSEEFKGIIKCLEREDLQGLDSLTELRLLRKGFTCLKPGAFQGLNKIKEIDLTNNKINEIEAGVFGALCKNDFEFSCKNVTLPEYCDNTYALKTLEVLRLHSNNISHIHPLAFVSCTNLQWLDLSYNLFLTLDNPFLFTPGLRTLNFNHCYVTIIPNNTFECTPLLSEIDLYSNAITKLTVDILLPLKHLKYIDIKYIWYLPCDCDLYETWFWMRQHRVHYNMHCRDTKNENHTIYDKVDRNLPNLICNNTETSNYLEQNRTTDTKDFAFFKQYIETILLIIIFIFGLVTNGFLLFICLRHSDMRTKQNACVIHLSIVDLLSLLLNLPISYWDVVNIRWEFDETFCKMFITSKDIIVGVNVFSIVALSVERFLLARNFNDLKKICKSESQPTAWLLLMTWISGIVCSLPAYFSAMVDVRCLYCPPGNPDYVRNVWTFQLIMFCLLPAFAIIFLNIKTSLFLRESIHKIPGEIKDNIRAKNRKTSANIVMILVLVFVISYLSSYILRVLVAWSVLDMKDVFLPSFFTFCLFFFNSVFNPISIFIVSSKFKSYALRYLPFLENTRDSTPVPSYENRNLYRHKADREKR